MTAHPELPDLEGSRTVAAYRESFRRHRALFFVVLLLGGLGGLAGSKLAPAQYTAYAAVLVTPNGVNDPNPAGNRAPAGVDLDTEIQLAQSNQVSQTAAQTLGVSPGVVSDRTIVVVPANSRVLRIGYLAQTPVAAARGADAVANAYLKVRTASTQADLTAQLARRADQIAALQAELKATVAALGKLQPSDPKYVYTQSQIQVQTAQVSLASRNRSALETLIVTPGAELNAAVPPTKASGSTRKQHVLEGLLIGLVLACGAVHLADRQRRRVRTPQDLRELLGPTALVLPTRSAGPHASGEGQPEDTRPEHLGGTAPDALLAGHLVATLPHGGVVELRPLGTQHPVSLVLGTARHLVAAGYDVTVAAWPGARVDDPDAFADAVRSTGQPPDEGVAEIVLKRQTARTGSEPQRLRVVGQGGLVEQASARVNDATMRRRFELVRETADYLIVLGPRRVSSTGGVNDQADSVVLLTKAHRTQLRDVDAAARRVAASARPRQVGALLEPARKLWFLPGRNRSTEGFSSARRRVSATSGR